MRDDFTLVILRHAHRDTSHGRQLDNGLSKRGKRQAQDIKKFLRMRFGKNSEAVLLSSPKKRCIETLEPLADYLDAEIEVYSSLGEQERGESSRAFELRIKKTFAEIKKNKSSLVILCSHGDWVPVAAKVLVGLPVDLSKGGWMEFSGRKKPQLKWVCQKLE